MGQHQVVPPNVNFVDKRRARHNGHTPGEVDYPELVRGHATDILFDCTAAGTTTTLVGTDNTGDDNTRRIRIGDKFKLFVTSTGALVDNEVRTVTDIESNDTNTTVTFTPATSANTAATDDARLVSTVDYMSNDNLDARLNAIDSTLYTQANLDRMTQNDKVYALRVRDDLGASY